VTTRGYLQEATSFWNGVIRGPEFVSGGRPESSCPLRNSRALIIGSNSTVRATGVKNSRRFLRELDETPGGNNLHYILQRLCVPASVTRVQTRKVRWVAMERSRNDGSKTQYYIVILDQLWDRSGGLEWAPESRVRGPLTKHVPGESIGKADGLSRRLDWQERVEKDNKDWTLIKPEWVRGAETIVEEGNLRERIKTAQKGNERVVKVVEELKKAGVKTLRDEEWEIENGIVLKEGRIYVPEGELRGEIIRLYHDTPVGGHGGRWKTTELVTRNYWWPGVTKEIERYVDGCNACQRYKNRSEALAGKLMPNAVPEKPWSYISADFITKLPLAQGYDAILVVCDKFSKMAHFIATTERMSAEGLARLFRDQVWKLHGLPKSIVSDRGVQFAAGMMKELNNLLGIQMKLLIAYHLQTDGQTERVN